MGNAKERKESLASESVYYGNKFILIMEYLSDFSINIVNLNEFSNEEKRNILTVFTECSVVLSNVSSEEEFLKYNRISMLFLVWKDYKRELLEVSGKLPELKFYVEKLCKDDNTIVRVYFYKGESQEEETTINLWKL